VKVLFVGNPNAAPEMGGAHGFQNSVVNALLKAESEHQFFYVTPVHGQTLVQTMVATNAIELVWFLSPYYEPCEAPFAITVWDLAHREIPYFPEVSLSGWTWDQRQAFYSYVLPRAALVVVGTEEGAEQVDKYYHVRRENIAVIPLPVDVDVDGPVTAYPVEKPFLFYPAQFWPHKNHVTLIDMLVELHKRDKGYKLVFTGADKGNQSYVEKYALDHGVSPYVHFAGFVSPETLRWLYKNAFAMVYASLMGPDNLPPLEALAYGCPVISSYPVYKGAPIRCMNPLNAEEWANHVIRWEEKRWEKKSRPIPILGQNGETYMSMVTSHLDAFAKIRRLWGHGYKHT
jgi:glycosyltransferase involved in cell wall biosynthesis